MNDRRFSRLKAAAWFTLFVLPPVAARGAEPIGAARCGTCHEAIYEDWKDTAHARSLASLTESQRADPACRTCHTLAPASEDVALEGVQCESCHGLGSAYAPEHVMRDARLSRMLGLIEITAETCQACHEGVQARLRPYDYRAMLEDVAHPRAEEDTAP